MITVNGEIGSFSVKKRNKFRIFLGKTPFSHSTYSKAVTITGRSQEKLKLTFVFSLKFPVPYDNGF